ncbi:MAG: glycosyltransferase family 2 protein [Muribaculaceae bacterium]|nr:glycosyltransferase family 2 protein [Muribaculaceae bacterium]
MILRCLESILAQTVRPHSLIVVDNNSTDDTQARIEEWIDNNCGKTEMVISLLEEETPGACAARNAGLKAVKSPYTLFFDSDDVMRVQLIEKAEEAIKKGNEPDLIVWQAEVISTDGRKYKKPFHTSALAYRQIYNSILSTQQYLAKTTLFRRVGGWNNDALIWNDWELGLRIVATNPSVEYIPEVLVTIYSQAESITGTSYHSKRGQRETTLRIIDDCLNQTTSPNNIHKEIRHALPYIAINIAAHYAREKTEEETYKSLKAYALSGATPIEKIKLRLLFHYLHLGGRAAYYLWALPH